MMHGLDALLARGVADEVYPLARAEVWLEGRHVFSGGNAPAHTVFDLASLTKVMATTALVLEARLPLDAPVRRWFPDAALEATVDDLLFHRSGLSPFVPFFAEQLRARPWLLDAACPASERAVAREALLSKVLRWPPERPAGVQAAYSDLGFIVLGAILEAELRSGLDELFARRLASPLGLQARFRRVSHPGPLPTALAETGTARPRPPAPGQEGLWEIAAQASAKGEVDDDNAWALDGVSGHAGLFATAADVASFGQAVLEGRVGRSDRFARDSTPASTRARGFDTPSAAGASCGPRFGRAGPRGAIGHTGFTGTSLWIDLDRALVVALLTNRVALGRANMKIREFRPRFHDAVLDALGL